MIDLQRYVASLHGFILKHKMPYVRDTPSAALARHFSQNGYFNEPAAIHAGEFCKHGATGRRPRYFSLFEDFDKAQKAASSILEAQSQEEKRLYWFGKGPRSTQNREHWHNKSDAAVGRRILARLAKHG